MERYCLATSVMKAIGDGRYLCAAQHLYKMGLKPVGSVTFTGTEGRGNWKRVSKVAPLVYKVSDVEKRFGVIPDILLTEKQAENITFFDEADIPYPALVTIHPR